MEDPEEDLSAYDPKNFIYTDEKGTLLDEKTIQERGERREKRRKEKAAKPKDPVYYELPGPEMRKLCAAGGAFALPLLLHLYDLWYKDWHHNPVIKLPNFDKMERKRKGRQLEKLEELGFVSVEQPPGKSPIVTLLFKLPVP